MLHKTWHMVRDDRATLRVSVMMEIDAEIGIDPVLVELAVITGRARGDMAASCEIGPDGLWTDDARRHPLNTIRLLGGTPLMAELSCGLVAELTRRAVPLGDDWAWADWLMGGGAPRGPSGAART